MSSEKIMKTETKVNPKAKELLDFINESLAKCAFIIIGVKSIISNQVIRKYSRSRKIESVKSVILIIPLGELK